jgi:hypothetical protein
VIRCPPVRGVAGESALDDASFGQPSSSIASSASIRRSGGDGTSSLPRHRRRLEHEESRRFRREDVEREQWMAQVIEHAEEEHEVELLPTPREVVHLQALELHSLLEFEHIGCPTRLPEVTLVRVDPEHVRAALRQFERVEAGVAATGSRPMRRPYDWSVMRRARDR